MTPEQKKAYLEQVAAMRKAAVADQVQPTKLLSDKERVRLTQVREMLAKDQNPFSNDEMKEKGKNLGGSNPQDRVMVKRELTEEQVKALEAKWKSGKGYIKPSLKDAELDLDLGVGPVKPKFKEIQTESGKTLVPILYCTYCRVEVDEINATLGKTRPKVQVIEDVELSNMTVTRKVKVSSDQIIACPSCSLSIRKPRFPETHG